jgi:metal-responsive CopG/Arc/MetJ family transcriptional regulator
MIITLNIPDDLNRKLEAQKRKTGMSKSLLIRQILAAHLSARKEQV